MLEMIMVLAIGVVLIGIITSSFVTLGATQGLSGNTESVASLIRQARAMTFSSAADLQYGVHLDTTQAVLFQGPSYSASNSSNVVVSLGSKVTISSVTLYGGGSNIIFNRLTGETGNYGTTTLALVASPSVQKLIVVSPTGTVEIK